MFYLFAMLFMTCAATEMAAVMHLADAARNGRNPGIAGAELFLLFFVFRT